MMIKIRRIRIRAPSLLRRRKVYEWAANKKGRCKTGPRFHRRVIRPAQRKQPTRLVAIKLAARGTTRPRSALRGRCRVFLTALTASGRAPWGRLFCERDIAPHDGLLDQDI